MSYQIWVHDEDQLEKAASLLDEFNKNPSKPEYDVPIESVQESPAEFSADEEIPERTEKPAAQIHQFPPILTSFFILICSFVFFINLMQEIPMRKEGLSEKTFLMTPIQALFLFDLPPAIEQLEKVIQKYEVPPDQKLEELPPEIKRELDAVDRVPFWRGAYEWMLLKIKKEDTSQAEGPLFQRIREGEIWRLFSPCLLHQSFLHILFNMIWLWVLGRPIEQRVGSLRTLLVIVAAGVGSNTLQYLMTGPLFLGFSGVVMGLAGFIWMRERVAPWEGYPLNKTTVFFLLLFVGAIFVLQLVSFFVQMFSDYNFAPNIANTAHIGGALIGAWLGKFGYFAQKVKK